MKNKVNFAVIGGQYHYYCYGERDSLHSAKLRATECIEYWDNWKGWVKPKIYLLDDTKEVWDS